MDCRWEANAEIHTIHCFQNKIALDIVSHILAVNFRWHCYDLPWFRASLSDVATLIGPEATLGISVRIIVEVLDRIGIVAEPIDGPLHKTMS